MARAVRKSPYFLMKVHVTPRYYMTLLFVRFFLKHPLSPHLWCLFVSYFLLNLRLWNNCFIWEIFCLIFKKYEKLFPRNNIKFSTNRENSIWSYIIVKEAFDWSFSILIQNIDILKVHFLNDKSEYTMYFIPKRFPGTIRNLNMLTIFFK